MTSVLNVMFFHFSIFPFGIICKTYKHEQWYFILFEMVKWFMLCIKETIKHHGQHYYLEHVQTHQKDKLFTIPITYYEYDTYTYTRLHEYIAQPFTTFLIIYSFTIPSCGKYCLFIPRSWFPGHVYFYLFYIFIIIILVLVCRGHQCDKYRRN